MIIKQCEQKPYELTTNYFIKKIKIKLILSKTKYQINYLNFNITTKSIPYILTSRKPLLFLTTDSNLLKITAPIADFNFLAFE